MPFIRKGIKLIRSIGLLGNLSLYLNTILVITTTDILTSITTIILIYITRGIDLDISGRQSDCGKLLMLVIITMIVNRLWIDMIINSSFCIEVRLYGVIDSNTDLDS